MDERRRFMLHVRLTEREAAAIKAASQRAGKSASELCRDLLAPVLVLANDVSGGQKEQAEVQP